MTLAGGLCTSWPFIVSLLLTIVDNTFPYLYYRRQHADCQARFRTTYSSKK